MAFEKVPKGETWHAFDREGFKPSTGTKIFTRGKLVAGAVVVVAGVALYFMWPEMTDAPESPYGPIDPLSRPNPNNPGFDYRDRPLPMWLKPSPIDTDAATMQGEPPDDSSPRPSEVRESKDLKEEAKELGTRNKGGTPEPFRREIVPALQARIDSYIAQYGDDFSRFIRDRLPQYANNPEVLSELKELFQTTLEKRVKLYASVTGVSFQEIAQNPKLLDSLTRQAYFDFVQSLKVSHDSGETYKGALRIAKFSHWLDPYVVQTLQHKYGSSVSLTVIKNAVAFSPSNPDGAIDAYLKRLADLREQYGTRVDGATLQRAALSYPGEGKAEAFVEWKIKMHEDLHARFRARVDDGVIRFAALKFNNPEKAREFIVGYMNRLALLKAEFRQSDLTTLKYAAQYYTDLSKASAFVSSFEFQFADLNARYGDRVEPSAIKHILQSNPTQGKAELFLNEYLARLDMLNAQYGGRIDLWVIKYAALYYPGQAETYLDWYVQSYEELRRSGAKPRMIHDVLKRNSLVPVDALKKLV